MEIPEGLTRDQILEFLRIHAPKGLFGTNWKADIEPELIEETHGKIQGIEDKPTEYLKSLFYIPEIETYATKDEIMSSLGFKNSSKREIHYDGNEITLSDDTLTKLFDGLPPYVVRLPPDIPARVEDFDFKYLEPASPDLSAPVYPKPQPVVYFGDIHNEEDVVKLLETNRASVAAIHSEFQSLAKQFIDNVNPLKKMELLTKLIEIKFHIFTNLLTVDEAYPDKRRGKPRRYVVGNTDIFHSFLEQRVTGLLGMTGWKENKRITFDSKQGVYTRHVGGLIARLFLDSDPKIILDQKNTEIILKLLETYAYQVLFTTFDAIAIRYHLQELAVIINRHLNADFIVFDCENEGKTERCPRGLLTIDSPDDSYRLVFTDVTNDAVISQDNATRILMKYMELPVKRSGGRRNTRRRYRKRRSTRSNRRNKH